MTGTPQAIKLNEIEKDIQPSDFPRGSIWRAMVEQCGPRGVILLARYRANVSERLTLRDYGSLTRKAQARKFERDQEENKPTF